MALTAIPLSPIFKHFFIVLNPMVGRSMRKSWFFFGNLIRTPSLFAAEEIYSGVDDDNVDGGKKDDNKKNKQDSDSKK